MTELVDLRNLFIGLMVAFLERGFSHAAIVTIPMGSVHSSAGNAPCSVLLT